MLQPVWQFLIQNWKELLPSLLQFLGIVVGAWIVGRQIAAQAALQDSQARDKLFAELYERISDEIDACQELLCSFSIKVAGCSGKIEQYWWTKDQGINAPSPITYRGDELSKEHHEVLLSILKITGTLERYEIAFSDRRLLDVARGLLILQVHSGAEAFAAFWNLAYRFFPIDVPQDDPLSKVQTTIEPRRPADEELRKIGELGFRYSDECANMLGYLMDLRRVFQNSLLGHLFGRTLPARQPKKAGLLVICEDEAMLKEAERRIKEREDAIHSTVKKSRGETL